MNFHQHAHKVEANLDNIAEGECKERLEVRKDMHEEHKVEARLNRETMPVLPETHWNPKMMSHEAVHKVEADLCKDAKEESKERHQVCKEVHERHKVEAEVDNKECPSGPRDPPRWIRCGPHRKVLGKEKMPEEMAEVVVVRDAAAVAEAVVAVVVKRT